MQALGDHVLIKQPPPKDKEGNILLPDAVIKKDYAYGVLVSVGPGVTEKRLVGPDPMNDGEVDPLKDGDIVVFDPHGTRPLELSPTKDSELVVAHFSQLFCRIHPKQLEARKLPIPEK